MRPATTRRHYDSGLAIRAAWLHYAGGLTQAEVAVRLGVSAPKAHRLVAMANQAGAVKVTIDGAVAECLALEDRLTARHGLEMARVAPDLGPPGPWPAPGTAEAAGREPALPLRALGIAGASFLTAQIAALQGGVVGVGYGRTLLAAIEAMPRVPAGTLRFVSLMGGLTRNYAANPHDVIHRLADRTGGTAYVMPVPFIANSVADRAVFLSQRGMAEVHDLAGRADLLVAGIGTTAATTQLVAAGMLTAAEIEAVRASGGVGEMLGNFFSADGRPVQTDLAARILSPDPAALAGRRIVALAGGPGKVAAIRAVLDSGLLSGLITDERTAQALAEA